MSSSETDLRHLMSADVRLHEVGEEWRFHFEQALRSLPGDWMVREFGADPGHDNPWRFGGPGRPRLTAMVVELGTSQELLLQAEQQEDGTLAFFLVNGNGVNAEWAQMMTNVIAGSVASIGTTTGIEWSALLGPTMEIDADYRFSLSAQSALGGMNLVPTGQPLRESWPSPASFHSSGTRVSMPILVTGTAKGYGWPGVESQVARDLRTLCGLLSLTFDSTVAVRASAYPVEYGIRTAPEYPSWTMPSLIGHIPGDPQGEPLPLPTWTAVAWDRLAKNKRLIKALDAYLEGRYAESQHPSLSADAFTACIEALAINLVPMEKCNVCGAKSGIAANFRAALHLVLTDKEASFLAKMYGLRSTTVHTGALHGEEAFPGVGLFDMWSGNTPGDYRRQKLWQIRKAAGRLLLKELAGETA